jgi:putative ABC transport system permease protein
MWRNYLSVALRSLARHKVHAFINVFGLAVGLAACLLILIYVRYESRYDDWLPGADRVFQVQTVSTDPDEAESPLDQYTHGMIAESFAREFPQIDAITRLDPVNPVLLREGQPSFARIWLTDENFFRVLPLPLIRGDAATALAGMDSLVVSHSEAINRFGTVDAIGQTITAVRRGEQQALRVTGVFEDIPRASHMAFAMLGRMPEAERTECGWGCVSSFVYLKLRPGADAAAIARRLPLWERRAIPTAGAGVQQQPVAERFDWRLVNLRDVHLSGAPGVLERPGNDRTTLLTFAIVAVLILGMATINFVNLATARASQRAREVALRKVLGATRSQLIAQFLLESVLVTGIAVALAIAAVELALPWVAAALDADLEVRWLGGDGIAMPVIALWAVVGVAGGFYPAIYLSRYRPAEVLKANKSTAEPLGTGRLRSILVVIQFAVSIGLMICTMIVYSQTTFAQRSDLGFDREGLIQIGNVNRAAVIPQTETLMRQIARIDGVEAVAGSNVRVAMDQPLTATVQVPGRAQAETIGFYSVSPEFFETLRLRTLAGRPLSRNFANDDASVPLEPEEAAAAAQRALTERGANVVVNAAAARRLGSADPAAAIGRQVRVTLFGSSAPPVPVTIVGVVADSRFRSIREPVEAEMFFDRRIYNNIVVRSRVADAQAVRERVAALWRQLVPDVPFEADFADRALAQLYAAEAGRARTFAAFAALAVAIACLGLFGLAAFTAERRTKEIGIRKVFGARTIDIVGLLAWQFAKPVILANLIAWPLAWWAMRGWLNGFDARIALGPAPFLIAAATALVIAVGTIAGHAVRVSRTNPTHALRYE